MHTEEARVDGLKRMISFIVILFLLLVALVVGSQNDAVITVNYVIAQADIRISTLIAIVLAMGILIGFLLMTTTWLAMRIQVAGLKSKLKNVTKDA